MATITLTIPDAVLPRVRVALCAAANLPESNANAKQAVVDWIRTAVYTYEFRAATDARPPIVDPDVSGLVT